MTVRDNTRIVIKGAKTNNLKNISLDIPHNKLIVVTGVSGSGKSSLAFDIVAQEGQRRYFETLPSFARQFLGKLNRPDVDVIDGLSPVIAIGQKATGAHARSTVGTMSDIYDLLRLLYARTGKSIRDIDVTRALFSFNSEIGKCKRCNGIGKEEEIDLDRLISEPSRTIREGALAPTLPTGYIMYSQVTIDVLNDICKSEGFNVDVPWVKLTEDQRQVILYGSNKIKVPFGKHSLESRLKWTGIKAKPREEGFYKGMIPIMSDILRRDRNANILKYVHSIECSDCNGTRLNEDALSVMIHNKSIADIGSFELNELVSWINSNSWGKVGEEVTNKIKSHLEVLIDLGLGHLTIDRTSNSLTSSEIQRVRVANQLLVPLSDVLYVFDEPSIGLHHSENERMIHHFKRLVAKGNTVIVVEHDLDTIKQADHIIEIGPKAGDDGGELIYNGSLEEFLSQSNFDSISPTFRALTSDFVPDSTSQIESDEIQLLGCQNRNLKDIDVQFKVGGLNVVSGKSGVGKSSLVIGTLLKAVEEHIGGQIEGQLNLKKALNLDLINKLIFIDHSPIGKTPRSNPATYLGISDHIRDLFARLPESKSRGYTKSRFSFNNKGGRCESCQGAGKTQVGMHFLGNIDIICGLCNGDRFNSETLEVLYKGVSIADIYRLSINDALVFFADEKKILKGLQTLKDIGLGYLCLGQSSTTLSGGEAQRIKIANQLQKKDTGKSLFILNEPSTGLHHDDIESMLNLFDEIKQRENTIVCIEQNEHIIAYSDWHIELGYEGGKAGGQIAYQGTPVSQEKLNTTSVKNAEPKPESNNWIQLNGVTTNGLKNIDVRIPKDQLTVVTGVSGSGKSSLVYDTLFAEANACFTESLSTYNRSFIKQNSRAELVSFSGLGPSIGVNRGRTAMSGRSTVGTLLGVNDAFRLLYSRIAQNNGERFTAQHFSFNHHLGACPTCKGLGSQLKCNPDEIVLDSTKSILDGAISSNKAIAYYADLKGQFIATLKEAAKEKGWNLSEPWNKLHKDVQEGVLYGAGEKEWDVEWEFSTKSRSGVQELKAKWIGFCNYIDDEYERKLHNKNIENLEGLLHKVECRACSGARLKSELLEPTFIGKNISELSGMSIRKCLEHIENSAIENDDFLNAVCQLVLPVVKKTLKTVTNLGLDYLQLNRSIDTLSGGEYQRINLAGQLSTKLHGVTYVLDEPTLGLDQAQIEVLSDILKQIVNNGNTVVIVEHDPFFIEKADYIIEMGPGAGSLGGTLIFQGPISDILKQEDSVTYKLLNNRSKIEPLKTKGDGKCFEVNGAASNNLKSIDVVFNSGCVTAVTGVSGSGKSSLIKDTLYNSWIRKRPMGCSEIKGLYQFDEVILIDQKGLELNRTSTVFTYTGLMDKVRGVFAKTDSAKLSGIKKADFSYQSKNGKCPSCSGSGKVKTSMDFMSDIWLVCDECHGGRYSNKVQSILFNGKSISDVLDLSVVEAIEFFDDKAIGNDLVFLNRVGVGHLKLGQEGNTLSGGEAQRLKLATSLMQKSEGSTLYLIDEPSTGLHYFDILNLIDVFRSIIEEGDTILVIEHNKTIIDSADHIVTLGPGSGENGGELVD